MAISTSVSIFVLPSDECDNDEPHDGALFNERLTPFSGLPLPGLPFAFPGLPFPQRELNEPECLILCTRGSSRHGPEYESVETEEMVMAEARRVSLGCLACRGGVL
jgi:hypothetical protein